jgi:hypothetical protein
MTAQRLPRNFSVCYNLSSMVAWCCRNLLRCDPCYRHECGSFTDGHTSTEELECSRCCRGRIGAQLLQCAMRITCCQLSKSKLRARANKLQDMEICIPSSQFTAAEQALDSSPLFQRILPGEPNLYNAYKKDSPRFLDLKWRHIPIVLLSDTGTEIDESKTLREAEHSAAAFYSKEILEYFSVRDIKCIPIPSLASFIKYLCRLHFTLGDEMPRIRLEQLVDGMNLDEEWCRKSLSETAHVQYLLDLVNSKGDRIDDFSEKQVTCIITDQKTAECVTRIPGYWPSDQQLSS